MPRPQPHPSPLPPPRTEQEQVWQALLHRLHSDLRDMSLAIELCESSPDTLRGPKVRQAIGVGVDGLVSRLRTFKAWLLPAVALMALPVLSGCISEGVLLYRHLSAATVQYQDPTAFECTPYATPNKRGQLETCSRCQNVARIPKDAILSTVGEAPILIVPGASVVLCERTAWVLPPEPVTQTPPPPSETARGKR